MHNDKDKIKNMSREQLMELARKGKKKKSAIERVDRSKNHYPQSHAQRGQWFTQQIAIESIYNIPQSYRLKGNVDIELLGKVLNNIVERHESMRTTFTTLDFVPSQVIKPYEPFDVEVIDLTNYGKEEQEKRVEKINNDQIKIPFDLNTGPLYKFLIIKLSDAELILTFTLHHIIADGWSFGVIFGEITELYIRELNKQGALPPLSIQYVDYSEWQSEQMESSKFTKQREYWKQQLANAPASIRLPFDSPRPKVQTYKGNRILFQISGDKVQRLNEICLKSNVTSYHYLLSVFFLLLHCYSNDTDICVGSPMANRNRSELEPLIGLFINTIVLRSEMNGSNTFGEFLQSMKSISMKAAENSEVPFEKVVEDLDIYRDSAYAPLFQVLFVQMDRSMYQKQTNIPGIDVTQVHIPLKTAQYDLSLYLTVDKNEIEAMLEYNTDLFFEKTANEFIADYQKLLDITMEHQNEALAYYIRQIEIRKCTIAAASTFVSELLEESVNFWADRLALPYSIKFAPYSQIFQQLYTKDSMLRNNQKGTNVLLIRLEDWIQGKSTEEDLDSVAELLAENTEEFIAGMKQCKNIDALVYLCPPSQNIRDNKGLARMISIQENRIRKELMECKRIRIKNAAEALEEYQLWDYLDQRSDDEWHIPYIREFYSVLGTDIMSTLFQSYTHQEGKIYTLDAHSLQNMSNNDKIIHMITEELNEKDPILVVIGDIGKASKSVKNRIDTVIDEIDPKLSIAMIKEMYKVSDEDIILFTANDRFKDFAQSINLIHLNNEKLDINLKFIS